MVKVKRKINLIIPLSSDGVNNDGPDRDWNLHPEIFSQVLYHLSYIVSGDTDQSSLKCHR